MRLLYSTLFVRSLFFLVLTTLAFWPASTFASFGITPPYVRNTSLTRNSTYEQQILLVRGNPNEDLKAEVQVDAPEIQSWISIKEGTSSIPMPRGAQKVPMTVVVKVPADADFADYTGKIRIRTVPSDSAIAEGVVSISLGAQVDIDLSVIDKVIEDFRVRKISINDLNEGHKFGWLYFPGKIVFPILIENTGNVDIAPSKVVFKIYDHAGAVMLEETQQSGNISKIKPYKIEEVTAYLPTRLPAGNYLARYTIYNGNDIRQQGELNLSILPYGTLQTAGYGFMGLSIAHKISILLPIFTLMIVVLFIIHNRRTRSRRTT